jgi:predicted secreted Zn-dependent protease
MVGVQFHQTRHQQIAVQILAAFRWKAFAEFGDYAVYGSKPSALDDSIGQDDPRIGKDEILVSSGHGVLTRLPGISSDQ